jgi:hypothetical protein
MVDMHNFRSDEVVSICIQPIFPSVPWWETNWRRGNYVVNSPVRHPLWLNCRLLPLHSYTARTTNEGVSKSFRTESITK